MPLDLLREGAEITVSFEEKDGKNEATNVEMK
jgi:cold shock CspA family protein